MSKSGIIYSSTRLTNKKPQNRTLIFADVHSAAKPQPNNQPNWGCLKSLMNVPFADYPGLHYTVSRLMKKKVSVARLKSSNTFAFLPVWVDLIVRNCIHTLSSTLYINRLAK